MASPPLILQQGCKQLKRRRRATEAVPSHTPRLCSPHPSSTVQGCKQLKEAPPNDWGVDPAVLLSDTRVLDVLLHNSDRHHGGQGRAHPLPLPSRVWCCTPAAAAASPAVAQPTALHLAAVP